MCVTWLIHMCDMTHSNVWHDSFVRVTWLIHICEMTPSYHGSKRPRLKSTKLLKSNSSIQASKSQKRDFRDFSEIIVFYSNRNVKFKKFMNSEWREEKFWKGILGDKMRLCFWNKHQKIDLVFMQLARYNWTHERVLLCKNSLPESLTNKSNYSSLKVDIENLFLARVYSSPAAWAKDLSFDTCFRSVALFCDPQYLPRTSPHSNHCAWNSRIWHFQFRKALLSWRNVWKFHSCRGLDPCFICETWRTHMCDVTHSYVWHIHVLDMTRLCVWHEPFICVIWLLQMCDVTHSHVLHESIICLT